jgi:hypothetical protein
MIGADFFYELIFAHGLGVVIDMKGVRSECCNGILTDIFEKEDFDLLFFERMEDSWLDNISGSWIAGNPKTILYGGPCGGDGDTVVRHGGSEVFYME